MQRVSIVIPAHNEEKRIGETLKKYGSFFSNLKRKKLIDFEIIVVLNACKDRTKEIAQQNIFSELIILEFKQGGKGFAVIEGFKDAIARNNSLIGFVDADMSTAPEDFYDLVKNIDYADGVIASRYLAESQLTPPPLPVKVVGSRIFNFLLRSLFLLPYRDTQCGAKLFRAKAIHKVLPKLSMSQWAFDVELLYHMHKKSFFIKEIPTNWGEKEFSKIDYYRAGINMALGIIRLRIINSPFKGFIRMYNRLVNFSKYL